MKTILADKMIQDGVEDEDKWLSSGIADLQHNAFHMHRDLDSNNLKDALKYSAQMLSELCTSRLSPHKYYELLGDSRQKSASNQYAQDNDDFVSSESARQILLMKLPESFPHGSRVFIIDPMLATGGTIVKAIEMVKERGIDNKQIKVISDVAAPPALQKLSEKFPGLHVYTGTIDPTVNERGFIIPGLGDAGDRSFATRN